MARLLIVDDAKNIRRHLATFLETRGHDVTSAENGPQALAELGHEGGADLVLTDYRMAEMNGLELLDEVKRRDPDIPVIVMTAYATVPNAVAAMKAGASDYITKPFSLDQIAHVVDRALELRRLRAENRILRDTVERRPFLESDNPGMRRVLKTAEQIAATDAPVLLMGEGGSGKNVMARQIHRWSARREQPFVVVSCDTLSEQILESELFGRVRGSYPGASKDKPGRLDAADGGTLFLYEIGEMGAAIQKKFLRFVKDGCFERVGGQETLRANARIVAASSRDLAADLAEEGRFRRDLFYRLDVATLHLPPLRERPEDVLPLAERLLGAAAVHHHRPRLHFSAEAAAAIARYGWPGNIRELRNAIDRAAVLARRDVVTPEHLPDGLFHEAGETLTATSASLEDLEREHIVRVLAAAPTLEDAAARLGINVATLWRKRKRYQIE